MLAAMPGSTKLAVPIETALARNIRPDEPAWQGASGLGAYVRAAADGLAARPAADLMDGGAAFPRPEDI